MPKLTDEQIEHLQAERNELMLLLGAVSVACMLCLDDRYSAITTVQHINGMLNDARGGQGVSEARAAYYNELAAALHWMADGQKKNG